MGKEKPTMFVGVLEVLAVVFILILIVSTAMDIVSHFWVPRVGDVGEKIIPTWVPKPTPTCEELEGMERFTPATIDRCGCPDPQKIPQWITIAGCE